MVCSHLVSNSVYDLVSFVLNIDHVWESTHFLTEVGLFVFCHTPVVVGKKAHAATCNVQKREEAFK